MLTFNLVRQGVLGEVMHAEGAYNHDGRHIPLILPRTSFPLSLGARSRAIGLTS